MSYQLERGKFIERMRAEGLPESVCLKILREANTIDRLAVAECNGDWPADNGERQVTECPECGSYYVPSTILTIPGSKPKRKGCPSCRAAARVRRALQPYGMEPIIGGDPRGCTLKLKVPSGRTDDWGREGLCVPSREY